MPAWPRAREHRGPVTAGPRLERIVPFTFSAADSGADPRQIEPFREHMEALYGRNADAAWLEDGSAVSYHDMVRAIARDLAEELTDIDLVVTVEASPDCRHQSFPACLLSELVPGDPLVLGIADQGVAGPFTALRLAADRMAVGECRRALVLIMEQSTLPPDGAPARPHRDVAVALLLGPNGTMPLGRPTLTMTGRTAIAAPTATLGAPAPSVDAAGADALVVGAGLADLTPSPGVAITRAPAGHPCAGVWLALSDLLEKAAPDGPLPPDGPALSEWTVLVADRDPSLPYQCSVLLTIPIACATPRESLGATFPDGWAAIPNRGVPDPDRAGGGLPRPEETARTLPDEGVPDPDRAGGGLPRAEGGRYRAAAYDHGSAAAVALLHAEVSGGVLPAGPGGHVLVPAEVERSCGWYETPTGVRERAATAGESPVRVPIGTPGLVVLSIPGAGPRRADTPGAWQVGVAWIRLGLAERLLAQAAAYLRGRSVGTTVILNLPLVRANLAEAAAGVAEARALLDSGADTSALRRLHRCLDEVGRVCLHLYGASGFVTAGPGGEVRAGELLADTYAPTYAPPRELEQP